VSYGGSLAQRIRDAAPGRLDAFIDTFGSGYVDLAIELGVAPQRIDTIIDRDAAERHAGVKTDGTAAAASADTLAEPARLIAEGRLEVPIARVYPLTEIRAAYRHLERPYARQDRPHTLSATDANRSPAGHAATSSIQRHDRIHDPSQRR
jgi:hypothetical protein